MNDEEPIENLRVRALAAMGDINMSAWTFGPAQNLLISKIVSPMFLESLTSPPVRPVEENKYEYDRSIDGSLERVGKCCR